MPIRQPSSHKTIVNFLKQLRREIDAQDLYLELQSQGKKIGLATVYRALKNLHKQGLIQERISIKGKSLYSTNLFHQQHHLNCLNCQRSIVIDNCPINSKLDLWFQSQEFKVYYHKNSNIITIWDGIQQKSGYHRRIYRIFLDIIL